MTNATKTLSIIFVVLLVITGIVKISSNPGSSEAFRKKIVQVDSSKVNKLVIDRPNNQGNIVLAKNGENWKVQAEGESESYPADADAIKRAIGQVNQLQVKGVVTHDKDEYTRYKVDSLGTDLKLYNGDQQLAGVIVGAPQILSQREYNTYVRAEGDQTVYSVNGYLNSTFNRDVNGWRDKTVWKVDKPDISRIDFLFPADSSYSIEKSGSNSWISDNDTLKTTAVGTIVDHLSDLTAKGFVDSTNVDNFGKELYAVQMQLNNGTQKTLRFRKAAGDDNHYQVVASDYPYVFTVSKYTWDQSVFKPRQKLLKN